MNTISDVTISLFIGTGICLGAALGIFGATMMMCGICSLAAI